MGQDSKGEDWEDNSRHAGDAVGSMASEAERTSCINESANARGEAVCVLGALPLPRSLTRCARSFGCGERYQLTQRR